MSELITRLGGKRRVRWTTILGILLVPLTIAGLFLWGLWNPQDRLPEMTAVVVNKDEPVEIDGQITPIGRVLAGELIGTKTENFTWQLTDAEDAADGIQQGRYAAVVTIPKNFSAAATSAAEGPDAAERADVDIQTSPRGKLLDSAISTVVTEVTMRVLNEQLGTASVKNIFVGMDSLAEGIGEAASGASKLADGTEALSDGAQQLADGTTQLSSGASQLSSGASQLSGGVSQYAGGVSQYVSGVDQYTRGVDQLAPGASQLAGGLGDLNAGLADAAAGAHRAADGQQQLANGVAQYVDGVNSVAVPLQQAAAQMEQSLPQLIQLRDAIAGGQIPLPPDQQAQIVARLDQAIAEIQAAAGGGGQIGQLIQGGEQLKQGAQSSANGGKEMADGLSRLSGGLNGVTSGAQQLSSGAQQLSQNSQSVRDGGSQLVAGGGELASGASGLASGAGQLASGIDQTSSGAQQLASGTDDLASGTNELAGGLQEAKDQIPSYTDAQAEKVSETMVQPVQASRANDSLFHDNGVPLFTAIALWAGGLAAFSLLSPLWARARSAAKGVGSVTARSAESGLVIGGAQGLIAGVALPLILGYDAAQFWKFFGLAVLAGVAFGLVNQGLSALLGGFGRFLSFVALVTMFAAGVISTAPKFLQTAASVTPLGTAFGGFQEIATGLSGLASNVFVLTVWAALGLVLVALAVSRERRTLDPTRV